MVRWRGVEEERPCNIMVCMGDHSNREYVRQTAISHSQRPAAEHVEMAI